MGIHRSKPDLTKHSHSGIGCDNIVYTTSYMCGWRQTMEDAHIHASPLGDSKNSIFGVFDGHLGGDASAYVGKNFMKELQININYQKGLYEKALRQNFMRMDEKMRSDDCHQEMIKIRKELKEAQWKQQQEEWKMLSQQERQYKRQKTSEREKQRILQKLSKSELTSAGCTANVVLITPDKIYCANAGDSRAVACVKGQAVALSIDHKPDDPIEYQRIKKAGSYVHGDRVEGNLNLSRALGDFQFKRAELKPQQYAVTANPGITEFDNSHVDFIIMGCDGIWETKTNSEMVEWIKERLQKQAKDEAILQELFDELVCKQQYPDKIGSDNMSAILIRFIKSK